MFKSFEFIFITSLPLLDLFLTYRVAANQALSSLSIVELAPERVG